MAGYWPRSVFSLFFACLSIKAEKKNLADIQPS